MDIHQLSVQYLRDQDRILMRFNTTTQQELRLWLTRALLRGWWPHLCEGAQAMGAQAAPPAPAPPASDAAEGPEAPDLSTPFEEGGAELPLGAEPLLITEISQTRQGQRMAISFQEKRQDREEERGVELELEPALLQALVQLLSLSLKQTDWGLPEHPPSGDPAPDRPAVPGAPRYLH